MSRQPRIFLLVTAMVLLVLQAGCGGDSESTPEQNARGVVLVTVDEVRQDMLSTYGGEFELPALDGLARQGTLYTDLLTVAPMPRPALAAIMTGLAPDVTGVRSDVADRLPERFTTLAEKATAAGWDSAAFVSSYLASWSSGLERGFALFDGPEEVLIGPARYYPKARPGTEVAENFRQWLETVPADRPFFAWVHLADLHGVTSNVESIGFQDYKNAFPALEEALASLAATVEQRSTGQDVELFVAGTCGTLVHGEEARGASFWLTPETLKVPLVHVRFGGEEPASDVDEGRRWLPDLHRTLADRIGGEGATGADGIPLGASPAEVGDRTRYAWTWAPDDELAWPTLTAVSDGGELRTFTWNEITGAGESEDRYLDLASRRPATPRKRDLSDEARKKLEAAGYRLGNANTVPELPGKEARNRILENVNLLKHHFAEHRERRVAKMTRRVLEKHPENLSFLINRFYLMVMAGESVASKEILDKMLRLYPERQETLHWVAHHAFLLREYDRAEALLNAAMEIGPPEPDILYDMACSRALSGDTASSIDFLEKAIDSGYRNWEWIEQDSDLGSIRSDPAYTELMRSRTR